MYISSLSLVPNIYDWYCVVLGCRLWHRTVCLPALLVDCLRIFFSVEFSWLPWSCSADFCLFFLVEVLPCKVYEELWRVEMYECFFYFVKKTHLRSYWEQLVFNFSSYPLTISFVPQNLFLRCMVYFTLLMLFWKFIFWYFFVRIRLLWK